MELLKRLSPGSGSRRRRPEVVSRLPRRLAEKLRLGSSLPGTAQAAAGILRVSLRRRSRGCFLRATPPPVRCGHDVAGLKPKPLRGGIPTFGSTGCFLPDLSLGFLLSERDFHERSGIRADDDPGHVGVAKLRPATECWIPRLTLLCQAEPDPAFVRWHLRGGLPEVGLDDLSVMGNRAATRLIPFVSGFTNCLIRSCRSDWRMISQVAWKVSMSGLLAMDLRAM
jgi:hypothetical protein